jgi:DNA topoisomerase VI subunit B
MLDFCSRKELVAQAGHPPEDWPLVVLKELLDNALDACEDARLAPEVSVTVDNRGITVEDNGPGIPAATVAGTLDFAVRVSDKEAYVSPTRGAQGNALKTILAMPFVLDGKRGQVEIAAHGVRHLITFSVDPIRQQPILDHQQRDDRLVRSGTGVQVCWPDSSRSILTGARARFLQIANDYTVLNPHLTLTVNWFSQRHEVKATNPSWSKWRPSDKTSAQWYDRERFERLVASYIAYDADHRQDRTVRALVAEFHGMTGTAKQKAVLEATGTARLNLSALREGAGLDHDQVGKLLEAIQARTKPVKPEALGLIGRDHLTERFRGLGCEMETFAYKRQCGQQRDGIPWVIETAFGWCPESTDRRLVTGVNWSPGILNPFRELGSFGQSLDSVLEQQRAGRDEPIVFVLHVACPRVAYTDRGKSAVVIDGQATGDGEADAG